MHLRRLTVLAVLVLPAVWSLGSAPARAEDAPVRRGTLVVAIVSDPGHLNPAITLVALVYDRFPLRRAFVYVAAQVAGAMLASGLLYSLFREPIIEFERRHGLLRGGPGSELSAMVFGEYFPNPAVFGTAEDAWRIVSLQGAFIAEMVGTAFLALLIAVVTHPRNRDRPIARTEALLIGVGVAAIISVIAPLTQAGLNPARDFGPRLVCWFLGWGDIAIPGPRGGWFSVYIVAPCIGALIGGGLYRLVARLLPKHDSDDRP